MIGFGAGLLLFLYSIPLGCIFLLYTNISNLQESAKVWKTDLAILFLLIIISTLWAPISLTGIANNFAITWHNYNAKGIQEVVVYQLKNFTQLYKDGSFSLLVIPLTIKCFSNYISQKKRPKNVDLEPAINESLKSGTLIGYSHNKDVVISDTEMNQHCLVIGTTGAGKTTTILNFVASAAKRGLPCIYLDGKGSPDLVEKLKNIADQHKRTFKVFTLRPRDDLPNLAAYNPFSSGNATEWKNRIMSLFAQAEGKGQEHFSLAEQNYINFVSNVLYKLSKQEKQEIDLKTLLAFLEHPDLLLDGAIKVNDDILHDKLAKLHASDTAKQMVGDVIKLLELFIYSNYGTLFDITKHTSVINLSESLHNNEIVLFLFDASAYAEDTRKVAKMVINDINSSFANLNRFTPAYCIFDEFASYASSNLSDSISLHRSNGLHAIVGTQSIASIKLKSLETKRIAEELIACCNTYIIQKINHVEDAELFAELIGKQETSRYTTTLYDREISEEQQAKVIGNMQLVDKYIITPDEIKNLHQGEAIIYRKAANLKPIKVKVNCIN